MTPATADGGALLPLEALSDSEATQSSTAFTVVLPPVAQAVACSLSDLGIPSRDTRTTHALHPVAQAFACSLSDLGIPFQGDNLAMNGPAVIVL
jgi:hypothetical protein